MFKRHSQTPQSTGHHITFNHLLIVILALLIGTQVYLSNRLATSGMLISDLEENAIKLEEENRTLLSQSVDFMSLRELSDKAKIMGYVEPGNILDLSKNDTLALTSNTNSH